MKRFFISIIALTVLVGGGFAIWQVFENRANAAKLESEILKGLTEEELNEILNSEANVDRRAIAGLNDNAEKRRLFLKGMRETLALAAQARREDFAEKESFLINLKYKKKIFLANMYQLKLSVGKDKLFVVPQEEVEAVWKSNSNEELFQKDMKTLREIRIAAEKVKGKKNLVPELLGDALKKARNKWARTTILSEMAQKDSEFMNQKAIPLRIKILEAGILSNDYMREKLQSNINASEKEMTEYLNKHPEFDVRKKLAQAQEVLAKVKAGENFDDLVKEYSEDRASSERGGLYKDVKANVLWKEVEDAALKLKPNEIADELIESNLGFHIVKLVKKNNYKNDDLSDLKFSVKHIVLQKQFEEPGKKIPGIPKPFLTTKEIAKAEVEKAKREKLIGEIIEKNPISLPEDFKVILPEIKKVSDENDTKKVDSKNSKKAE